MLEIAACKFFFRLASRNKSPTRSRFCKRLLYETDFLGGTLLRWHEWPGAPRLSTLQHLCIDAEHEDRTAAIRQRECRGRVVSSRSRESWSRHKRRRLGGDRPPLHRARVRSRSQRRAPADAPCPAQRRVRQRARCVHNLDNDFMIDRAAQKSGKSWTAMKGFGIQDCGIQESMGPISDRTREHLDVNDTHIIKLRRLMLTSLTQMAEDREPTGSPAVVQRLSCFAVLSLQFSDERCFRCRGSVARRSRPPGWRDARDSAMRSQCGI